MKGEKAMSLGKKKNLSQEEVAEKLNVSRQTISKWETDQSTPDFDKISPLCDLYDIGADELLNRKKIEFGESEYTPKNNTSENNIKRAKGISLATLIYFISVVWLITSIPAFKVNPIIATGIFILICGVATYIIIYTNLVYRKEYSKKANRENKVLREVENVLALITCIIYMSISFFTMAWHITWLIWIIYALIIQIIKLLFALKGDSYEE